MDSTDDLLTALFARPDDEWHRGLDEACRRHPDRANELRRRFALLERCGVTSPTATADGEAPRRLGPYRLVRRLGDGGMGTVWLAQDEALGRDVAIKTIRPERLWFDKARDRFQREIAAVARLRHPGCVQIHRVGEADPVPWFAMEYVPGANCQQVVDALVERLDTTPIARLSGQDLAAVLRQGGAQVESATSELFVEPWVRVAIRIALAAAEALAHAHARGVVHRDLKPSNLMLTPEGRVVVIDFGLAFAAGTSSLTGAGSQLGSVPYMAPEQLRGDAAAIGVRTDVRGLGLCLRELLVLGPAFAAKNEQQLRADILDGSLPEMRATNTMVSRDLEVVVARAMHVDPERRYASALDFAADLAAVLDDRPVQARRDAPGERLSRWLRRHPARATAAALLLTALLVVPTIVTFAIAAERDRARAAEADARQREYVASVSAAGTALLAGSAGEARLRLDACAEEQRDFEWRHLALGLDAAFLVVPTGPAAVAAVAVSPDGEAVAAGHADGRIVVFGRADGRLRHDWIAGKGPIAAIGFDPSGRELFVVDAGRTLRVFAVATGEPLRQRDPADVHEHPRLPAPVDRVLVAHGNGRITTMDATTFAPRHEITLTLRDWPGDDRFAFTEQTIAAGAADGFTVWNTADGAIRASGGHALPTSLLGIDGDPPTVAGIDGHGLVVWSPGRTTASTLPLGGRQPLTALFLRQGRYLVAPCSGGEILVVDPVTLASRTLCGHRGAVTATVALPKSTSFVTGGDDGTVREWSAVATPRETELTGVGWGRSLAIDAKGRLYTGDDNAQVWAIDADSGRPAWNTGLPHWVNALAVIDRDAMLLASVGGTLWFVSTIDGSPKGRLDMPPDFGRGTRIVVAPDEGLVAVTSATGSLTLVDPAARAVVRHTRVHEDTIADAAFVTPRVLLTAGLDGTVHRVDVADDVVDRVLVRTDGACRAMALDGDVLYTSEQALDAATGSVRARDARSGRLLATHPVSDAIVVMRVLNGHRLVVGTRCGRVGFWSRTPLAPILDLPCFEQRVRNLAVAPDARWIAAIGTGGEPRILHTEPPAAPRERELTADLRDRIRALLDRLPWRPFAEAAIATDRDLDAAARARARALLPPKNRWGLGLQANALARSPALDAARRERLQELAPVLDEALALDIDDHGKQLGVGRALVAVRLGDPATALSALARVVLDETQGPDGDDGYFLPTAHFARGMAHLQQGDPGAARRERDVLAALVAGAFATDSRALLFLRELDEALR